MPLFYCIKYFFGNGLMFAGVEAKFVTWGGGIVAIVMVFRDVDKSMKR